MKTQPIEMRIPDDVERVAICGGPYSNFSATAAFLKATEGFAYRFCLGDIPGCGGALPDRTIDMLRQAKVICIQGNYDYAIGNAQGDCGCGYVDKQDVHYAHVSYDYNFGATSQANREWLKALPPQIALLWRGQRVLLAHGSPDNVNEFVWETATTDSKITEWLHRHWCAGICVTHSGLPWVRKIRGLKSGFWFNVGVLGRPAHEGRTSVYYGTLDFPKGQSVPQPAVVPLEYDFKATATAIREAGLPEEFARALELGEWTTGDKILPEQEKSVRIRVKEKA